jgi:hypothetical protein
MPVHGRDNAEPLLVIPRMLEGFARRWKAAAALCCSLDKISFLR